MPFNQCFPVYGDLELTTDGRDFVFVSGAAKIKQSIEARAKTFKGSWRYDRNVGVPYFDDILVAGPQIEIVHRRFFDLLMGTDGVNNVTFLDVQFDAQTETVYVAFAVVANAEIVNGTLDFVIVGG